MTEHVPLFSVITACRNDRVNLQATQRSLAGQTCRDFEWVVIDGASDDGTLEDLSSSPVENTRLCSEPDSGIYDAFAKGAERSAGRYLVYLCAGDTFADERTLARVKDFIAVEPGADLYYADAYDVGRDGIVGLRAARSHATIWWNLFAHHQAMFYARTCFAERNYDRSYRIGGDYAFTAEILHRGARAVRMPFPTARFQLGGTSYRNYWLGERENWRSRRELGYGVATCAAIWAAHAVIRIGRTEAPWLYERFRYASSPKRAASALAAPASSISVAGLEVTTSPLDAMVEAIIGDVSKGAAFSVNTLNLDHVTKLRDDAEYQRIYGTARYVVPDGFPIAMAGSLVLGRRVPRVCGSDLIEPLCARAGADNLPAFLYGSETKHLLAAADILRQRYPKLRIAGCRAPSMGFDPYSEEANRDISEIARSGAKIVFVALGAPRGEVFSARLAERMTSGAALSIGAGLDFIAGAQQRAPRVFRRTGLEWLWRLANDPRRLAGRYARSAAILPGVLIGTRRVG
jgi:N-acetylglucosaminyldiphosphoundecaprenol N-acetyl-beta-D-mannosaminyltransferase